MLTIIGGSGFIGTRLSNQLKSQNIDFKIVDIQKSEAHPEKWEFGDV
ncbi:TPA: UDP-N-acetylglucosamine 4-epimerase, partial [Escherichia coli]|nr:UDP-N-acetylglucosamine 4-epimerase [Escherichia coli]HAW2773097.1 UDP-N-acetylglucosamine 4-epimerase [Escherichia coli]